MKRFLSITGIFLAAFLICPGIKAQINVLQDYKNNSSAPIGTFQLINFREGGFSGLFPVPNTGGKEFWTCSDRGVNVDAANANLPACRPTYDKIYGFPNYAPKIHRIRLAGDSIQILQTITMKRPGGTTATGLLNPAGFGSTNVENVSTDTVLNCDNFLSKIASKDIWGIDAEGIVVDKNGYFWICEEGGVSIWKLNPNGVVVNRFTPFANKPGAQIQDIQIDTSFGYRKNNRGFEGIAVTPNGKIYAMIQSPLLYPTMAIGEGTRIHRLLEIDPVTNATRMFAYLNDGIIGTGSNQIRLRDWKIGDMAAINDSTFLVIEQALRGTTDIQKIYLINIKNATPVTSGLYSGVTLESLVDTTGLVANNIVPVKKTLFLDLLGNGWPAALEKAEGLAIVNDSTVVVGNDNDYGQVSVPQNGVATATGILSHIFKFGLQGGNKVPNFQLNNLVVSQGVTGPSTSTSPYLVPTRTGVNFTSILSVNDVVGGYRMAGIPDGLGAFDNSDGTFTLLMNHEIGNTLGVVRAHGSKGAFVSKWVIKKSDLSVVSGEDLMKRINLWNPGTSSYTEYSSSNPSTLAEFSRFCSADLPAVSAFYNSVTGLGTQERIFMDGEESGNEGRAIAHIVTGANAGTSWELPYLGKFSWENSVANPGTGDKTVVAGMDDATPGQVYFYIGTKTNAGTDIQKAGLSNGKLYSPIVSGLPLEISGSIPAAGTTFTMKDLGIVRDQTGANLQTLSNSGLNPVTQFLRPEDGAWDPLHPDDFYFVTTNAFNSPSRMWKLHFSNLNDLTLGGTITAVLDGTEGQQMLDNITIDAKGHVLLVEDVGNNARLGKVWQYNIGNDQFFEIGTHDSTRFLASGSNFLTQDEESSGIIDMQSILGPGMFLTDVQAHYTPSANSAEVVEGGQLLAFFNPAANEVGPSTSTTPYLVGTAPNVKFKSIITVNDVVGSYRMAGIPDGLGAFDNSDGTFTLLMNHEIGNTLGVVRAHGSKGAFVSKWVIKKSDLSVVSGEDLMKRINLWNPGTSSYTEYSSSNPSTLAEFSRFCSADLPAVSAFYNSVTGLGTQERIFMDGEESGNEGRAIAHIVTGANAGTSWELPYLGKFSWENSVANPGTGDKTVVAGMDDATPGQVYFYIGTKTNAGTDIQKAGLSNGKLYSPIVSGLPLEISGSIPAAGTAFTMADLGQVQNLTGANLQANSIAAGVTQFLRPEDGAWDPLHPEDFYFVTTNAFNSPSRMWKLHFSNLNDLTLGGTITAVLDGTEGQQMLDNITIDTKGHVLLVEDVGNNARLGKVWQYNIGNDQFFEIGTHDSTRFLAGGSKFLTQDEESSGIIDVQSILGPGMYLTDVQAHYTPSANSAEVVEGGQLLALYNPFGINTPPSVTITNPINPPPLGNSPYKPGNDIPFQVQASDVDGAVVKVEFYNGPFKIGVDSTAPYEILAEDVDAGNYTITAVGFDNSGDSTISAPVNVNLIACSPAGTITGYAYADVQGSQVSQLVSSPNYPNNPTFVASLDKFEYVGGAGADNYGGRVVGFICAPQTGYYTFYISADDQAGLWLSTDADPAHKSLIAYTELWTGFREYFKYASQKSVSIKLVKGATYYIEALHKEYVGQDHLSVAWLMPNGTLEAPIAGNRLSPWGSLAQPLTTGQSFDVALSNLGGTGVTIKGLVVKASPNPSTSHFVISTRSNISKPLTIVVTDVLGRVVDRRSNIAANGTIQIGGQLQPGLYFVEVRQGDEKQKLKLVRQ